MKKSVLAPQGVHPPVGAYSHGFKVEGKRVLFLAGQVGIDPSGNLVSPGDVAAQLEQTLENIRLLLAEGGADFSNVVKFTTFLRNYEDAPRFMEARRELFPRYFPDGVYPPNSLVIVKSLVREDLLIEIEAIAVTD
ncbi:MAG TPA: RidA family protein [Dehalococcoidia bacterium]|jgi:enamine deaminase RidA (YjgF/YER057c/UK114 family)|nr:RidA family protein [Dehalococcoidia bacterium]